jgi:UDP-galactopyranose mutase
MKKGFFKEFDLDSKFHNQMTGQFLVNKDLSFDSDLLVFSHLRWDFVFQRPQHLLTRFAKNRRVYFIEEPLFSDLRLSSYNIKERENGVRVVVPVLSETLDQEQVWTELKKLVNRLILEEEIEKYSSWYYTPMALPFTRHLTPESIIYDCMDELSAFKNAPADMIEFETELMKMSDLVFTGGHALFEAKKHRHHNIHPFPSSIDGVHFRKARVIKNDPEDQKHIPHPRLGFFGVIDERMDVELVDQIAALRPDWHIVMIGPVVKIDLATLPKRSNIHYLGKKDYKELPQYLSGWDLAMLPFARNESTQFISPTKTPEYLAAGRPVVSTTIKDVVRPYFHEKLVYIADTAEDFVVCAEKAMLEAKTRTEWLVRVDAFLAEMSWDSTFEKMAQLERKVRGLQFKVSPLTKVRKQEVQLGT